LSLLIPTLLEPSLQSCTLRTASSVFRGSHQYLQMSGSTAKQSYDSITYKNIPETEIDKIAVFTAAFEYFPNEANLR
jgi:hypothetical protein